MGQKWYSIPGDPESIRITSQNQLKQNQLINLDEVEKGIYFVKVSNTTGEKTVRLVIE